MSQPKIALRKGLFTEGEKGAALIASRCNTCNRVFFPSRVYCPECFGREMKQVSLYGPGKLYTYTISQMPTQHYKPPYAVGWIEFPEGLRVFGQIKGWQEKPLKTGMSMRLIIDTLWEEPDKDIVGYKFEPVAG